MEKLLLLRQKKRPRSSVVVDGRKCNAGSRQVASRPSVSVSAAAAAYVAAAAAAAASYSLCSTRQLSHFSAAIQVNELPLETSCQAAQNDQLSEHKSTVTSPSFAVLCCRRFFRFRTKTERLEYCLRFAISLWIAPYSFENFLDQELSVWVNENACRDWRPLDT